jgi:O-antigen ligase
MTDNIKALIVIFAIALVVFRLAKPIALRFCDERDFNRRRNVWFILTITAFVSPSFWLFVLIAAPLLAWAGHKDKNPIALYLLMLHVIPSIPLNIPVPGLSAFFDLDIYRLLSICILVPTAWRVRKSDDPSRLHGVTSMDAVLLAYGALQIVLFVPPDLPNHVIMQDTFTNDMRRSFLFFVDVYIIFYAVSRSCTSRASIVDAQVAFCLSCALMAALAVFEATRHWLLYPDLALRWSTYLNAGFYGSRGGQLRAQASSGNTLALAYLLAIGCGFWIYLRSHIESKLVSILVFTLLCMGLISTYSRGPLLGLVVIYVTVIAVSPRPMPNLLKGAFGALILIILVGLTPLRDRVSNLLPFMGGSVDEQAKFSVTYRQRLAESAWEIIIQHPVFGDQLADTELEPLRQGEGIIDFVNTYAEVTVFYGFVGLALFMGLMLLALFKTIRFARSIARENPDMALLGFCLTGCILGTLDMLATSSMIYGYGILFYVIAGFAAAYANLAKSHKFGTLADGPLSQPPELR